MKGIHGQRPLSLFLNWIQRESLLDSVVSLGGLLFVKKQMSGMCKRGKFFSKYLFLSFLSPQKIGPRI